MNVEIRATEIALRLLPSLRDAAISLALAFITAALLLDTRPVVKWQRTTLRIFGLLFLFPTLLSVWDGWSSMTNDSYRAAIASPDGKHVADYEYDPGFLGRDSAIVTIRSANSIRTYDVYSHFGSDLQNATKIQWLNSNELKIGYFPHPKDDQECLGKSDGISIHCEVLPGEPWPTRGALAVAQ